MSAKAHEKANAAPRVPSSTAVIDAPLQALPWPKFVPSLSAHRRCELLTNFPVFGANEHACSGVSMSAEAHENANAAPRVPTDTAVIDAPLQALPWPKFVPSFSTHLRCVLLSISALLAGPLAFGQEFTKEQLQLPGKKGIGYILPVTEHRQRSPEENDAIRKRNAQRVDALNVSWNYSWGMNRVAEQPAGVEFIPMVWGAGSRNPEEASRRLVENLRENVVPHIRNGSVKRILGFNEPDREKQANMTVEQALAVWPILELLKIPLCSPSCANTEGTDATDPANQGTGGNWMPHFMSEVDRLGLRVDYIGTHGYPGPSARGFKRKLERIYEKYNRRPLLITEFAVADWSTGGDISKNRYTQAQVLDFMKELLPWMERQDWILGYAWFPFEIDSPPGTCSALFDAENKLTALGRYYRSITPDNPDGDQSIQPD